MAAPAAAMTTPSSPTWTTSPGAPPAAATYQGWCRKDDVLIDWNRPAQVVYNLIRGADPQPGAWTTHAGKTLQIFDGAIKVAADGAPGEVCHVGEDGVVIAAADAAILAKRLRGEDGKKRPAHEVAAATGMAPGARLG